MKKMRKKIMPTIGVIAVAATPVVSVLTTTKKTDSYKAVASLSQYDSEILLDDSVSLENLRKNEIFKLEKRIHEIKTSIDVLSEKIKAITNSPEGVQFKKEFEEDLRIIKEKDRLILVRRSTWLTLLKNAKTKKELLHDVNYSWAELRNFIYDWEGIFDKASSKINGIYKKISGAEITKIKQEISEKTDKIIKEIINTRLNLGRILSSSDDKLRIFLKAADTISAGVKDVKEKYKDVILLPKLKSLNEKLDEITTDFHKVLKQLADDFDKIQSDNLAALKKALNTQDAKIAHKDKTAAEIVSKITDAKTLKDELNIDLTKLSPTSDYGIKAVADKDGNITISVEMVTGGAKIEFSPIQVRTMKHLSDAEIIRQRTKEEKLKLHEKNIAILKKAFTDARKDIIFKHYFKGDKVKTKWTASKISNQIFSAKTLKEELNIDLTNLPKTSDFQFIGFGTKDGVIEITISVWTQGAKKQSTIVERIKYKTDDQINKENDIIDENLLTHTFLLDSVHLTNSDIVADTLAKTIMANPLSEFKKLLNLDLDTYPKLKSRIKFHIQAKPDGNVVLSVKLRKSDGSFTTVESRIFKANKIGYWTREGTSISGFYFVWHEGKEFVTGWQDLV